MTAPKLTKSQIALLREAASGGGTISSERHNRALFKMSQMALLVWAGSECPDHWRITQAGRDALEGLG